MAVILSRLDELRDISMYWGTSALCGKSAILGMQLLLDVDGYVQERRNSIVNALD